MLYLIGYIFLAAGSIVLGSIFAAFSKDKK